MVNISAIFTMIITLLITLAGPVAILLYYGLRHRKQGVWSAWGLGALGFFVTQVIIRIPILQTLSQSSGFVSFANSHYIVYVLILAFTAGLFELTGRYVVAKLMSKNLTYRRSVAAGLGHGGIEALVIVGMTYINNVLYSFMINTGAFDALIDQIAAMGMDIYPYVSIKQTLIETPAYLYLFAGYERVLTMITHLAMSLIVCYFVAKKQDLKGCLICLLLHTLLDSSTLLLYFFPVEQGSFGVGYVLTYAFLTLMAVISIFVIRQLGKKFKELESSLS